MTADTQEKQRYLVLHEKRKTQTLSAEEEQEYINLYNSLADQNIVERLPEYMLTQNYDRRLDDLLQKGKDILAKRGISI